MVGSTCHPIEVPLKNTRNSWWFAVENNLALFVPSKSLGMQVVYTWEKAGSFFAVVVIIQIKYIKLFPFFTFFMHHIDALKRGEKEHSFIQVSHCVHRYGWHRGKFF